VGRKQSGSWHICRKIGVAEIRTQYLTLWPQIHERALLTSLFTGICPSRHMALLCGGVLCVERVGGRLRGIWQRAKNAMNYG
jgi:hypothetical protein